MNLVSTLELNGVNFLYNEIISRMPRTFAKRNFVAYNETVIEHALHMVKTGSIVVLNIYLFCYTVKVHELFLRSKKNFYAFLKNVTQITLVTVLKMASGHRS